MGSCTTLEHWRGGAAGALSGATMSAAKPRTVAAVFRSSTETEDDDGDGDDEGPFIDLEFTVPDEDGDKSDDDGGTLRADSNLSSSPSEDLLFKGRFVPMKPASLVISTPESNSKPMFPSSLLKSATKFRVFMLKRSKKSKTATFEHNSATATPALAAASPKQQQEQPSKFFVRFNVEEVPLVSLFTRDNSSRSSTSSSSTAAPAPAPTPAAAEEKKFTREVLQRYLSKIRSFRSSTQNGTDSATVKAGTERQKPRRLGKSRSASAAVAAVRSPPSRRDDSLVQMQDGIQSAIAHCKRSFNSDKAGLEPPLVRSNSDPGNGRSETCKA